MSDVEAHVEAIRQGLVAKSAARESALALCRETIRTSANAIRALHRHEFEAAERLVAQARSTIDQAVAALREHGDVRYAGFVHDAQKEFAEASLVLALVRDRPAPGPAELGVEGPAYLNGLAETVGELRRHLLDRLRRGEVAAGEPLLARMDEIYGLLVTVDFPDAMTGGLRRTTDGVRGIVEKTRGDLTVALRQRQLEERLAELERRLPSEDR